MVDDTKKLANQWLSRIKEEQHKHKKFRDRAKKALEIYENDLSFTNDDELDKKKKVYFPVFRSVVDVQLGALTSKMPQARLTKEFEMQQQSQLCEKLEKAVNYFIEKGNMQSEVYQSAEDYLTAGVGGMKVVYDATYIEQPKTIQAADAYGVLQTYELEETEEVLQSETLVAERFTWKGFGWQPGNERWTDVDWCYWENTFTVSEFEDKWGVTPSKVADGKKGENTDTVTVYEIWDKSEEERLFICDCHDDVLDRDENPLNTDYFYPCAEPMWFGLADDELTPCPEFHFWDALHTRIQQLSEREGNLIKRYKDLNFYDENAFKEAVQIEDAIDGDNLPIDLKAYQVGDGVPDIRKLFMAKDNTTTGTTLAMVKENISEGLSRIYQITGIGDIMQAASDPNETATAQNLKHSWGSARLSAKRFCIENHIRGTIEVMTNTMVKTFEPESIAMAAGEMLTPEEVAELQASDEYHIDVETLSTLSIDKDRDQQNTIDMVNTFTQLFNPQNGVPQPLQLNLATTLTETFVNGRDVKETVDTLPQYFNQMQQLQQALQQAQEQLAQTQQQNIAMADQLNKYNQAKQQKDIADAEKKAAEAEETRVDTVQKAASMMVPPNAIVDERLAYPQQPTVYNPNGILPG